MAGIVTGGEVGFTGPQAGAMDTDEMLEMGARELLLGNQSAILGLNPPDPFGVSSNGPIQTQDAPQDQPTLEQMEELERTRQTAQQPTQNWQQLYGQSENEKGELRRQLAAAQEAQNQLQMQQQMHAIQMQMLSAQQAQPQPAPQPQHYGPPPNMFGNRERTELITVQDVEDRFVPIFQGLYNEAQGARQQAQALETQLINSKKLAAGITPMVEFQTLAENPWINSLAGGAKVDAIASVLALKRAQTPVPPAPVQPAPAQMAAAPRQLLYVGEQGRPTAREPVQIDPQLVMQQEWAATMALPLSGGKREAAQAAILQKYGAQRVSGWRDPNILSRY